MKRLLLRESQAQPLIVIFDDLHWIDSETQALLDSLVESLPTSSLLLLVNYRPEYEHRWGARHTICSSASTPYPRERGGVLAGLLGPDPTLHPLTQLLIDRTEGNPFFLEK